jgi:hypothetical protein
VEWPEELLFYPGLLVKASLIWWHSILILEIVSLGFERPFVKQKQGPLASWLKLRIVLFDSALCPQRPWFNFGTSKWELSFSFRFGSGIQPHSPPIIAPPILMLFLVVGRIMVSQRYLKSFIPWACEYEILQGKEELRLLISWRADGRIILEHLSRTNVILGRQEGGFEGGGSAHSQGIQVACRCCKTQQKGFSTHASRGMLPKAVCFGLPFHRIIR